MNQKEFERIRAAGGILCHNPECKCNNPDIGTVTESIGPEGEIEYCHTVTPREQVLDAMIKEWLWIREHRIDNGSMLNDINYVELGAAFEAIMGRKAGSPNLTPTQK